MWIRAIRVIDSQCSCNQKKDMLKVVRWRTKFTFLKKKKSAIATPTQEIWLADDVIPPRPVFVWYAAYHWIPPLHLYCIGIIGVSNTGCHWQNRHGVGSRGLRGNILAPASFMCMIRGRASPKSRTQHALGEAIALIPSTHIPEHPGSSHSSIQGPVSISEKTSFRKIS